MASVGGDKESVSLNIMPMLDIFSILILFLLMNFSTDPINHDVGEGIELPESITTVSLDETPTISVSKTEIMVNDKKILSLMGGDVEKKDRSQGAILPLFHELEKLAENNKRFTSKDAKKVNYLTIEMDKTHTFKLLKRIMNTAQQADFIEFKLMVSKEIE